MTTIDLREAAGESTLRMSTVVASEIVRLGIASVSPTIGGEWRVTGISKVGVVRFGEAEVRIEPKVPLERLFYLLARGRDWGSWFEQSVQLDTVADLYPAIAEAFVTWAERILRGGVLRGYRTIRAAEPAIRGRWLVAEQIRIRQGLPLPAELQYDEFTSDIAENQLIRSAARRLAAFAYLPDSVRARILRVDLQLGDVTLLTRGQPLPTIHFDRRSERYRPLVVLAELILTNGSLDHRIASTSATGFLLDMPRVFEQFVESEVIRAVSPFGGQVVPQLETSLDVDGHVRIRPDLVWIESGRARAVFDAKYKAEKPAGYPNADIYQMLAYCIRHELSSGHLIYAAGSTVPPRYRIAEAGVEIFCHSLALDRTPEQISAQIDAIVAMSIDSTSLRSDVMDEVECMHEMLESECAICGDRAPASRSPEIDRTGHEKLLVYCRSITDDTLLHSNRQGESYRLRAFAGRLAGKPAWIQADAPTSTDFLRIYRLENQIDVSAERLSVEQVDQWKTLVAAENRRLGIGR